MTAEVKMRSRYMERIQLEERLAELSARKDDVVKGYLKRLNANYCHYRPCTRILSRTAVRMIPMGEVGGLEADRRIHNDVVVATVGGSRQQRHLHPIIPHTTPSGPPSTASSYSGSFTSSRTGSSTTTTTEGKTTMMAIHG